MRFLVGDVHEFVCGHCQMSHLGSPPNGCVSCGCRSLTDSGVPQEGRSFPAAAPCRKCVENLRRIQAVVVLGGVGWRCVTCGSLGAAEKGSVLADSLRKKFPDKKDMCEIDGTECPECKKNETPN